MNNYQNSNNNYQENYSQQHYNGYGGTPQNHNNTKIIILLLIVILLGTIAVSAIIIGKLIGNSNNSNGDKEQPTTTETVVSEQAAETPVVLITYAPTPVPTPVVTPIPTPVPTIKPAMTAHKTNISWTQANQAAAAKGGSLISIDSASEFTSACNLAQSKGIKVFWVSPYSQYKNSKWLPGEPSGISENGEAENYLMVFKVQNSWYFNDSVNDVSSVYSGKIGYIVEY